MIFTLGRVPGKRREPRQDRLEPDAVHARRRQARQVAVRIRIQRRIEQRIAIQREVGVTIPRGKGAGTCEPVPAGLGQTRQLFDKLEQGLLRLADAGGEFRTQDVGNCLGAFASADIGRMILQGLTLGLQVAQLDEEESSSRSEKANSSAVQPRSRKSCS